MEKPVSKKRNYFLIQPLSFIELFCYIQSRKISTMNYNEGFGLLGMMISMNSSIFFIISIASSLIIFLLILLARMNQSIVLPNYGEEEGTVARLTKILLVDDNATVRKGLRYILSGTENIEVVDEAENGKVALRKMKSDIDLVMMDVRMPEMDGVTATRLVKQRNPKTKVLALSLYDDKASINSMMKQGASGYVLKGDSKSEILNAINLLSKNRTYFSRNIAHAN